MNQAVLNQQTGIRRPIWTMWSQILNIPLHLVNPQLVSYWPNLPMRLATESNKKIDGIRIEALWSRSSFCSPSPAPPHLLFPPLSLPPHSFSIGEFDRGMGTQNIMQLSKGLNQLFFFGVQGQKMGTSATMSNFHFGIVWCAWVDSDRPAFWVLDLGRWMQGHNIRRPYPPPLPFSPQSTSRPSSTCVVTSHVVWGRWGGVEDAYFTRAWRRTGGIRKIASSKDFNNFE